MKLPCMVADGGGVVFFHGGLLAREWRNQLIHIELS